MSEDQGSVTRWLGDLKAGDQEAAQRLWERDFDRLVSLARAKLRAARRSGADDEEDAALSAFDRSCAGATRGRFPELEDRDHLWHDLEPIGHLHDRGPERVQPDRDLPAACGT